MKLKASTVCARALCEYVKSEALKTTMTRQRYEKKRLNMRIHPVNDAIKIVKTIKASFRTDYRWSVYQYNACRTLGMSKSRHYPGRLTITSLLLLCFSLLFLFCVFLFVLLSLLL